MRLRRDPLLVAARIAAFVRDLTVELGGDQVGTVGRLDVVPALVNVVPSTSVSSPTMRRRPSGPAKVRMFTISPTAPA